MVAMGLTLMAAVYGMYVGRKGFKQLRGRKSKNKRAGISRRVDYLLALPGKKDSENMHNQNGNIFCLLLQARMRAIANLFQR